MLPVPAGGYPAGHKHSLPCRYDFLLMVTGQIPVTVNLINIFFILKDQPLPDIRYNVVPWAIQNSAAMKKCL
jgi:hypothetical protein